MNSRDRQAWIIAVGLFVSLFFLWGSGYNTSPVFLSALLKAFGWSHSKASWLPSILVLAVGITGPMTGWLLDHFDARAVMGTGAALTGASFILASRATTFTELVVAYVGLGVGLGASSWMPASVVIANWFGERRGTALGLATAGMEFGGMAMAIVAGHIISQHGWSAAYFALSIPVFVLVVPFLAIFVAYLTGIGYTLQFATTAFATLAGLAAVGKPAMGVLGDRIGGKNALAIALLLIATSHMLVLGAGREWLLIVYLLVVGLSVASPVALAPLVLAETMGLKRFGTLYGWIQVAAMLGLFGGPLIAGELFDLTRSYAVSFEVAALLAVAGAAASFLCAAPQASGMVLAAPAHGAAG